MRQHEALDIIASLPRDRTLFYYFKDRYAAMLLENLLTRTYHIGDLKKSRFARLLQRPAIAELIKAKGDGKISKSDLARCWPLNPLCYRLTLGTWGEEKPRYDRSYYQTSRRGVNLVLQLNFSRKHDSEYERLIDKTGAQPFNFDGHPLARQGFNTLAWARIDFDHDKGEALIEELQSDWVRYLKWGRLRLFNEIRKDQTTIEFRGVTLSYETFINYLFNVVYDHLKLWDEAMLSAAIWFLNAELGFKTIYLHDYDTGNRLKSIASRCPPRSLYSDLPRKFCFTKVEHAPRFLSEKPTRALKTITKAKSLRFWQLDLLSE